MEKNKDSQDDSSSSEEEEEVQQRPRTLRARQGRVMLRPERDKVDMESESSESEEEEDEGGRKYSLRNRPPKPAPKASKFIVTTCEKDKIHGMFQCKLAFYVPTVSEGTEEDSRGVDGRVRTVPIRQVRQIVAGRSTLSTL